MVKRLLLGAALLFLAIPVFAQGKDKTEHLLDSQVIATGTPVSVTVSDPTHSAAYLIIQTSLETNTATLTPTVSLVSAAGDTLLCTGPAITTETTTAIQVGSGIATSVGGAGGSEGIDANCPYPLARSTKFTFTVTGALADFTVEADLEWVGGAN